MNSVSVILPVHNEESYISDTIGAIISQDYSGPVEIIVADGMSTDQTRSIIRGFQEKNANIFLIDNPHKIVPTGMNLGLSQATGEIIVRVDGHTLIAPDYVRQCVEALQRSGADNVGGRMRAEGVSRFGQAVAVATSTPFGVGGSRFHYSDQEEWVDTVYMGAWPRRVFKEIGGFDEELVRDQDDEFNYRLRKHGGKILLSPKIQSRYTNRGSPKTLWRQYFQYGFYKVRVLQKHPRQMSVRQFIPPAFVLSILVSVLLSFLFPWGWIFPAMVLGAYLLINLGVSVCTASRKGLKHIFLLPVCFAILHVSYGIGFLAGLWHFCNRWGDRVGRVPSVNKELGPPERIILGKLD